MTFLFYMIILLLITAFGVTIILLRKKKRRTFAVQRLLVPSALFCLLVLLGAFIRGYFFFDQEQYGTKYNQQRLRLGVDTLPRNFDLIKSPIKGWTDYFEKHNTYKLVYQSNGNASGHFRKEVDVGEDAPGRELDFYLQGKDTIITTFIYLSRSKSIDTVFTPNSNLLQ